MAPTKKDEKEVKLTPDQSAALILDYLRKQNRPYSATDISTNLKNRVTKSAAAKLLKDMHERSDIEGKAAGKQIVYHAIQQEPEESSIEALQAMEVEAKRFKEETVALKTEEKELRLALREGFSQVPLPEVKATVGRLEQEKADVLARLAKLKSGNIKPTSADERDRINREYAMWQKAANDRKKIRVELWKSIEGNLEKKEAAELKESWELDV